MEAGLPGGLWKPCPPASAEKSAVAAEWPSQSSPPG